MRWPWPKPWSRSSYDPGCLRRSMVERARGFQKAESSEERAKGISNMKQRMPCNACGAHGKTVYGHWHSDKECPYFEETKKKKEKSAFVTESGGPAEDRAAFVVGQAGTGDGCICTAFSRWGWFCCEIGKHVPGDLLDGQYQRFLIEKLEQEQPRLVVFECPRMEFS